MYNININLTKFYLPMKKIITTAIILMSLPVMAFADIPVLGVERGVETGGVTDITDYSVTVYGTLEFTKTDQTSVVFATVDQDVENLAVNAEFSTLRQERNWESIHFGLGIEGLTPNTKYYAQAQMIDEDGNVYFGKIVEFITDHDMIEIPSVVTGEATEIGARKAVVTGLRESSWGVAVAETYVRYGITRDDLSFKKEVTQTSSDFSLTLFKLERSTTYYYQTVVEDSEGNQYFGAIKTFTTLERKAS